jgi:hypothetical protein
MSKEAEEFFRQKTIENAKRPRMKKFLALVNRKAEGNILQEYADQQLRLYDVTPRYSVSLVFVNAKESLLRCLIIDAVNEQEALGKALDYYKEETKGFNLSMKVVLPSYNVG